MSQEHSIRVRPRSRASLRKDACQLLAYCGIDEPYVPVVDLLEFHLANLGVTYEYVPREEMGMDHGRSFPNDGRVQIRDDVYERACEGRGRDRLTIAHEIGHLVLHHGLPLQRSDPPRNVIKPYEDSEWQANAFAGELLMPLPWVRRRCHGPDDLPELFGVSDSAAQTHWQALCREGVIWNGRRKTAERGASSIRRVHTK